MISLKRFVLAAVLVLAPLASVATEITPEDQIPLKIEAAQKSAGSESAGQKTILTLALVGIMLGVGYYFLKKKMFINKPGQSNMQIKILSQHFLGPKKSLAIIRVAGESMLIGVTDQNISMLKTLSLLDDELPAVLPQDFDETMITKAENDDKIEEEFTDVKTTVFQKIKSMRNIQ